MIKTFGTDDTEWFCGTETILNTLFNVKTRNSPEYARYIIQDLTKRLYSDVAVPSTEESKGDEGMKIENLEGGSALNSQIPNETEVNMVNPLRTDITDMHYAQLFFVVGHTAIKMLSYIEQLDNEMKRQNGG